MNTNTIVLVLGLAAIGGGLYYVHQQQSKQVAPSPITNVSTPKPGSSPNDSADGGIFGSGVTTSDISQIVGLFA